MELNAVLLKQSEEKPMNKYVNILGKNEMLTKSGNVNIVNIVNILKNRLNVYTKSENGQKKNGKCKHCQHYITILLRDVS